MFAGVVAAAALSLSAGLTFSGIGQANSGYANGVVANNSAANQIMNNSLDTTTSNRSETNLTRLNGNESSTDVAANGNDLVSNNGDNDRSAKATPSESEWDNWTTFELFEKYPILENLTSIVTTMDRNSTNNETMTVQSQQASLANQTAESGNKSNIEPQSQQGGSGSNSSSGNMTTSPSSVRPPTFPLESKNASKTSMTNDTNNNESSGANIYGGPIINNSNNNNSISNNSNNNNNNTISNSNSNIMISTPNSTRNTGSNDTNANSVNGSSGPKDAQYLVQLQNSVNALNQSFTELRNELFNFKTNTNISTFAPSESAQQPNSTLSNDTSSDITGSNQTGSTTNSGVIFSSSKRITGNLEKDDYIIVGHFAENSKIKVDRELQLKIPCNEDKEPDMKLLVGSIPNMNELDLGKAIDNATITDGSKGEVTLSKDGQYCLYRAELPETTSDVILVNDSGDTLKLSNMRYYVTISESIDQ
jgi:hypothetical protein